MIRYCVTYTTDDDWYVYDDRYAALCAVAKQAKLDLTHAEDCGHEPSIAALTTVAMLESVEAADGCGVVLMPAGDTATVLAYCPN